MTEAYDDLLDWYLRQRLDDLELLAMETAASAARVNGALRGVAATLRAAARATGGATGGATEGRQALGATDGPGGAV